MALSRPYSLIIESVMVIVILTARIVLHVVLFNTAFVVRVPCIPLSLLSPIQSYTFNLHVNDINLLLQFAK